MQNGWEIPAELSAVRGYLDYIKTLPAWKRVDYGPEAIIKGWERHIRHAAQH